VFEPPPPTIVPVPPLLATAGAGSVLLDEQARKYPAMMNENNGL
jgi:hypothetical protein